MEVSAIQFNIDEVIPFPAPLVYETLRDRTPELVPFLREIDRIETVQRQRSIDGSLVLTNLWQANRQSVPRAARPFVSREMLRWRDIATWDDTQLRLDWRFETEHMEALYTCNGTNYVKPLNDTTSRLSVTGTIETFPERVPGISNRLGRRIAPKADRWLIQLLMPNIAQVPKALSQLLAHQ